MKEYELTEGTVMGQMIHVGGTKEKRGKFICELVTKFLNQDYFELELRFPDGSYRKLFISHKALLAKFPSAR